MPVSLRIVNRTSPSVSTKASFCRTNRKNENPRRSRRNLLNQDWIVLALKNLLWKIVPCKARYIPPRRMKRFA